MKKFISVILASALVVSMVAGCSSTKKEETKQDAAKTEQTAEKKVYNVCNLVNGNLGDKSFFDSAETGLKELQDAGRITYKTIEMGASTDDQAKWQSYLEEVSSSKEYDIIICGTYQMPDYLKAVAEEYPDQKYIIYDDTTYEQANVLHISYKQNDLGYIVGVFAASLTTDTSFANINADPVVGFVGGTDSPVINDFLYGFILGAQSVNPDIKVDTRYVGSYIDPAKGKELAESMINDKKCDIVWGVAGNSGNGAAEAAQETGKAYFIGVDSDQEQTLSTELAAITLTSGLKNVGQSLVWVFDELDAGNEHWGEFVTLGINEGGVGIVTDKNFATTPKAVQDAVTKALDDVSTGKVTVPTAIGEKSGAVEALRESVKP
ncbi:hypothetical protein SDC9_125692 [bioreactor metagenome]|uniref:ABC transporter substrate-binding protein PnrA-like domain-containing protein n=1 Tax=bioreactor metagenome TaxID=1076179 RepID=A0A645CP34_9ZZZZ